jgi:hypothetical protein
VTDENETETEIEVESGSPDDEVAQAEEAAQAAEEKPKRRRRAKDEEVEVVDPGHVAVNDDNGNPKTILDDHPRQPPSAPNDDPLRWRPPNATYGDYLIQCSSLGAVALEEDDWEKLPA